MMVCMAGLQVFVVRFFFQGARKGAYCRSQHYSVRPRLGMANMTSFCPQDNGLRLTIPHRLRMMCLQ